MLHKLKHGSALSLSGESTAISHVFYGCKFLPKNIYICSKVNKKFLHDKINDFLVSTNLHADCLYKMDLDFISTMNFSLSCLFKISA